MVRTPSEKEAESRHAAEYGEVIDMKALGGTLLLGLLLTLLGLYVFQEAGNPITGTGPIGVLALICLGVAKLITMGAQKLFGGKKQ